MSSVYEERVQIFREAEPGDCGDPDPDTGIIPPCPPGSDTIVLDQRADVQDKPTVLMRDASGAPTLMADAQVFLSDESALSGIQIGDTMVVTWKDGSTSDGEVMKTQRLDGSVFLRRL